MNKLTNLLNIFSLVALLSVPALSFAGNDDGVEKRGTSANPIMSEAAINYLSTIHSAMW